MGYELAIRPRAAGKPIPARALVDLLQAAAATGIAGAAAMPPAQPAAASPAVSQASEKPATAQPAPAGPETAQAPAPAAAEPDLSKAGPWTISNGRARLGARIYRAEGEARGADLDVPFGGTEEELRRALDFSFALADKLDALVFDPQLGREVVRSSTDDVLARWRQSQAWATDVTGEASDYRGVLEVKPPPPLLSGRTKAALLIVGGFIVLYVLVSSIMDLLMSV